MSHRRRFDVPRKNREEENEWLLWSDFYNEGVVSTKNISIIQGDLFTAPKHFALAHCVSSDMKMSRGIAASFRSKYGGVNELLSQGQSPGGLAVKQHKGRHLFYLVTKKRFFQKPTYEDVFRSLRKLREYIDKNNIHDLAIPKLACGRDHKDWKLIKPMISFLFRNVDCRIHVYV